MTDSLFHTSTPPEAISLSALNLQVKGAINRAFPDGCWLQAETSDVRANATSGHCYLEFIEKDPKTGQLLAKARATIWAKTYRMLKPYFEQETGQRFTSGIKVMVKVLVDYHEVYGFNLTIVDIDPTYTLGDMMRKRLEIIRQLQEEGVFTLNKELEFPTLPQRIAVITSPTAAGYEDFMNQLTHHTAGYCFYTRLFPAVMQGEKTEVSVVAALDAVYEHYELFDVVVIIRGGGATSELASFDSYLLAAHCAQFPIPVLTGIGHERDDTIVDMVAHRRLKTPTAVAEFLIEQMDEVAQEINNLCERVRLQATTHLKEQKNYLQLMGTRLPALVTGRLERNRNLLQGITGRLPHLASTLLTRHDSLLGNLTGRLQNSLVHFGNEKRRHLELTEQFLKMVSPDYILRRGYSLTLKEGKIIKKAEDIQPGDRLTTRFTDGEVESTVHEIVKNK
ncbi:exodeoxyribonuclease VII large subunit [Parabacteroides sp. PFB2-12]|uniref:exodeoxyribonuclease VII large subunit n=1 Tax=unclassified Parabacteroides TaxID=2649774 RepID=UPI002474C8A5|nr:MULTISPECIES: exodeoxyribonuclease VII large subunit [unclassified Parabacteroides]MDH6341321.1 exodeoxyribonuclease VII large subunit [Parabacteroides sp. PM6-13]MDH6389115.1 exodeoxyribonuclease VII large subunit [Parabacteroides sp. PFB2-12]